MGSGATRRHLAAAPTIPAPVRAVVAVAASSTVEWAVSWAVAAFRAASARLAAAMGCASLWRSPCPR